MGDEDIQSTNDDASISKLCAIQLGYWKDDYLKIFLKASSSRQNAKKAPEINRGYYIRVKCIHNILKNFLQTCDYDSAQVLSLGCGYDTLFWRLCDDENLSKKIRTFVEIDFVPISAQKIFAIKRHSQLHEKVRNPQYTQTDLISDNYNLLGIDLRHINELESKLRKVPNLDFTKPTIFLSECVLVYMKDKLSEELLTLLRNLFSNSLFIIYEMINLSDSFGKILIENVQSSKSGILLGLKSCSSLQSQIDRFLDTGWLGAKAWTLTEIYQTIIDPRIEQIEHLDESELLTQLLDHYCICIAWNTCNFSKIDFK